MSKELQAQGPMFAILRALLRSSHIPLLIVAPATTGRVTSKEVLLSFKTVEGVIRHRQNLGYQLLGNMVLEYYPLSIHEIDIYCGHH